MSLRKADRITNKKCIDGFSMKTIDFLGGEFTLDYSTSTGKHQPC